MASFRAIEHLLYVVPYYMSNSCGRSSYHTKAATPIRKRPFEDLPGVNARSIVELRVRLPCIVIDLPKQTNKLLVQRRALDSFEGLNLAITVSFRSCFVFCELRVFNSGDGRATSLETVPSSGKDTRTVHCY